MSSRGSRVDVLETSKDWPGDDRSGGAERTGRCGHRPDQAVRHRPRHRGPTRGVRLLAVSVPPAMARTTLTGSCPRLSRPSPDHQRLLRLDESSLRLGASLVISDVAPDPVDPGWVVADSDGWQDFDLRTRRLYLLKRKRTDTTPPCCSYLRFTRRGGRIT
jgi:hypothetical protein